MAEKNKKLILCNLRPFLYFASTYKKDLYYNQKVLNTIVELIIKDEKERENNGTYNKI